MYYTLIFTDGSRYKGQYLPTKPKKGIDEVLLYQNILVSSRTSGLASTCSCTAVKNVTAVLRIVGGSVDVDLGVVFV